MITTQEEAAGSPGLSANALKAIAVAAMFIDHAAHALVAPTTPQNLIIYGIMRFIGRITAPVMFYFIAEGYHYTRDKNKYTLRLAVFAAISYLPFVFFISGGLPKGKDFFAFDVIYTLLIGLLALRAYREISNRWMRTIAIIGLIALSVPGDWGSLAVIYILAFDYFRGSFRNQALAYLVITALTGAADYLTPIYNALTGRFVGSQSVAMALINLGRFIPIGLLYFYNGKKGPGGKWAQWGFYIVYPLHLIALCIIAGKLM